MCAVAPARKCLSVSGQPAGNARASGGTAVVWVCVSVRLRFSCMVELSSAPVDYAAAPEEDLGDAEQPPIEAGSWTWTELSMGR